MTVKNEELCYKGRVTLTNNLCLWNRATFWPEIKVVMHNLYDYPRTDISVVHLGNEEEVKTIIGHYQHENDCRYTTERNKTFCFTVRPTTEDDINLIFSPVPNRKQADPEQLEQNLRFCVTFRGFYDAAIENFLEGLYKVQRNHLSG